MRRYRAWTPFGLLAITLAMAAQSPATNAITPSSVSVKGPLDLSQAIKILQQTGNAVVDLRERYGQERTNPTLQLNLEKASFWQAADAVAKESKLALRPWRDEKAKSTALGFVNALDEISQPQPIAYDGPFRLAVKRLTADRHFEDASLSALTIQTELTWEPRYQPLLLKMNPQSVKATGADGQATPVDQGGSSAVRLLGEAAADIPLRLPLPPRSQQVLAKLEAQFLILTPPAQVTFQLPKAAASDQQTKEGIELRIDRVESGRMGVWSIAVTLTYPSGTLDLESHQGWALDANEMVLKRNGQRLVAKLNRDVFIEDGGAMHVTYYFDAGSGKPADYGVEYRTFAPPLAYSAKFAFTELPLP